MNFEQAQPLFKPRLTKKTEPIGIKASSRFESDWLVEGDGGPGCRAAFILSSTLSVALAPERWIDVV